MTLPIFKDREYLNATAGLNIRPHTNAIRNQFDYITDIIEAENDVKIDATNLDLSLIQGRHF